MTSQFGLWLEIHSSTVVTMCRDKTHESVLEKAHRVRAVADELVFRLLVMIEHHLVVFAADARLLVASKSRVRRIEVVAVRPDSAGLNASAK